MRIIKDIRDELTDAFAVTIYDLLSGRHGLGATWALVEDEGQISGGLNNVVIKNGKDIVFDDWGIKVENPDQMVLNTFSIFQREATQSEAIVVFRADEHPQDQKRYKYSLRSGFVFEPKPQ